MPRMRVDALSRRLGERERTSSSHNVRIADTPAKATREHTAYDSACPRGPDFAHKAPPIRVGKEPNFPTPSKNPTFQALHKTQLSDLFMNPTFQPLDSSTNQPFTSA